jgi:hypothetical protein
MVAIQKIAPFQVNRPRKWRSMAYPTVHSSMSIRCKAATNGRGFSFCAQKCKLCAQNLQLESDGASPQLMYPRRMRAKSDFTTRG